MPQIFPPQDCELWKMGADHFNKACAGGDFGETSVAGESQSDHRDIVPLYHQSFVYFRVPHIHM